MLKIRLQRIGRTGDPSFRIITTQLHRGPKSGKSVEILGSYDPRRDAAVIKGERVKYWISKGAQVSDTVHNLLIKKSIIEGKKIDVSAKKKIKASADVVKETKEAGIKEEETKSESTDESQPQESKVEEKEAKAAIDSPEEAKIASDSPKEEVKEKTAPTLSTPTKSSERDVGAPIPEGVGEKEKED